VGLLPLPTEGEKLRRRPRALSAFFRTSSGISFPSSVLDPRLLKGKAWSYPEATRRMYAESISDFGFRTSRHDRAVDWLREQAAARSRKAG